MFLSIISKLVFRARRSVQFRFLLPPKQLCLLSVGTVLCLKAGFFAYLPQSVMRFEYPKGYANAFAPISRDGSSCIPVTKIFAYPKTAQNAYLFPPTIFTTNKTNNRAPRRLTMCIAVADASPSCLRRWWRQI